MFIGNFRKSLRGSINKFYCVIDRRITPSNLLHFIEYEGKMQQVSTLPSIPDFSETVLYKMHDEARW